MQETINYASHKKITKKEVHIVYDENLFVHLVNSTAVPNRFESTLIIDGKHPYFYENQTTASHVSGLHLIDVQRQLTMAIGYHFYAVPVDYRFILRSG